MKNKLACFDLDGTLFDTSLVNYYAYNQALNEEGYTLEKEHYVKECNGRHYTEFLPMITNYAKEDVIEKIHNRKKELYSAYLDKTIINVSLFQILEGLKKMGYKTAIVTTASHKNTKELLMYHHKLECFDLLMTAEQYELRKPHPECYIKTMEKLNSDKENTIIFEDSSVGVEAAMASGAVVYIVTNLK